MQEKKFTGEETVLSVSALEHPWPAILGQSRHLERRDVAAG